MKLKQIFFNKIKSGEKVYEIRLNDDKRRLIAINDEIIFKKEPELQEKLITTVQDLIYFKSFDEMVNSLSLAKIGFANFSKEEVKNEYYRIYSQNDEKKFGVVAIKLKLIKKD